MSLADKKCIPCEVGGVPLPTSEVQFYAKNIPAWTVGMEAKKISRLFKFKNFLEAMIFVNKVADLAEKEGHHPDIAVSYNKVTLELTTHAIGGLSVNDFIVAEKVDLLNP